MAVLHSALVSSCHATRFPRPCTALCHLPSPPSSAQCLSVDTHTGASSRSQDWPPNSLLSICPGWIMVCTCTVAAKIKRHTETDRDRRGDRGDRHRDPTHHRHLAHVLVGKCSLAGVKTTTVTVHQRLSITIVCKAQRIQDT